MTSFPIIISNPPGLSAISYRVGDYTSFREELLQNLPGEIALAGWRPSAEGDLALQLLEWWAYLADILTFYNERIANASYLGTAIPPGLTDPTNIPGPAQTNSGAPGLPDTTTLIAGAAGFRAQPGLSATGQLAVLVNGTTPVTLPPNFAIQSKPGPGQQPQVFQADTTDTQYVPTGAGGAVPVDVSRATWFTAAGGIVPAVPGTAGPAGPLLKGAVTSIKNADVVVVAQIGPPPSSTTTFAATVTEVTTETDPRGRTNTRLAFGSTTVPAAFTGQTAANDVTNFQVLRGQQSTTPYAYNINGAAYAVTGLNPGENPAGLHLAALTRQISVGDLVVLEYFTEANPAPAGPAMYLPAAVINYQETLWYANADDPLTAPQTIPAKSVGPRATEIAIPITHSFLTLDGGVLDEWDQTRTISRVLYGYRPVTEILDEIPTPSIPANAIANYFITPAGVNYPKPQVGMPVLLEGANGLGAVATLTSLAPPLWLASTSPASLALPMRVLFNVINVSAGKTVTNEILGSGDATVASQSFQLAKSPLTYSQGTNPGAPVSTLQVQVDGVPWMEVPNFLGQANVAHVFETREDKNQVTTVTFGDGVNGGARLTTGTGNVTATYKYGSGPGAPALGGPAPLTLVTILTPVPGVGSIRNPVPMTGGAAPGPPAVVQQSGPAATLALGVAISPGDFAAIAAQTPSVTRARAVSGWTAAARRPAMTVYVDGGPDAVAATQTALASATDPNRPVIVAPATAIGLSLSLTVLYDPSFAPAGLQASVIAALTDQSAGPFAPSLQGIGDPLYGSQISAACLSIAGVLAVRSLTIGILSVTAAGQATVQMLTGPVYNPGPGGFFTLTPANTAIVMETANG